MPEVAPIHQDVNCTMQSDQSRSKLPQQTADSLSLTFRSMPSINAVDLEL